MVADANRPESVIANGPVLGAYEPFEYLDTTGSRSAARSDVVEHATSRPRTSEQQGHKRDTTQWFFQANHFLPFSPTILSLYPTKKNGGETGIRTQGRGNAVSGFQNHLGGGVGLSWM